MLEFKDLETMAFEELSEEDFDEEIFSQESVLSKVLHRCPPTD